MEKEIIEYNDCGIMFGDTVRPKGPPPPGIPDSGIKISLLKTGKGSMSHLCDDCDAIFGNSSG